MKPATRTLRIIVEDNTTKNPIPCKARIWIRGHGDMYVRHRGRCDDFDADIGIHEADLCIHPGYVHCDHPGHTFRYEMQPVEHKAGSSAYFAMGTIYVDFSDDAIVVHGVPIAVDVLRFDRDDRPKDTTGSDADCSRLLAEVLRKSNERDQKLQDASVEIVRLKKRVASMQSVISNSSPHARLLDCEERVYRMLCAMNTASRYAVDRDTLQKFCGDVYKAESPVGVFHPPYFDVTNNG